MIQITDLNHVSLIVADVEASKRFYCDVLGMEETPRPATFHFAGAWVRRGGAELHLIQRSDAAQAAGDPPRRPRPDADVSRARHIGFAVADIEAALATLKAHGVEVVLGPRPRGDGVIQVYCCDPDGHLIELHSPPPPPA